MPLSWNEIRTRAINFSRDWKDESKENAEAQTFWNEFFDVFGKKRRHVAAFEAPVKGIAGASDRIDLLWSGMLIAEHKSRGKSLEKAQTQAFGYVQSLINNNREHEAPRYICVSDFAQIALHDLDTGESVTIPVADLHEHIHHFDFIAGYKRQHIDPEDPANIEAAELLADLHDTLEDGGYPSHDLERFMVRLLFCMFAEDTGLFDEPNALTLYIENSTADDGSDLGIHLAKWFQVLDTKKSKRQANLDERLADLPYVNGNLFTDRLPFADFNAKMRSKLLACCHFKWHKISPAVFGSLFQSIMEPKDRRQIGAHYTSERDILKLINSLFMDDLRTKFEKAKASKPKLRRFHESLGELNFLDPACGCGNFLVIAYRELRRLELSVLKALHPMREGAETGSQQVLNVREQLFVDVDQFYGIEIDEWPTRIAEVAMWLMDHQMNLEASLAFGQPVLRLPLDHSATIANANALRFDWNEVLRAEECSFVMGNPPFVGAKYQTKDQRAEVKEIWNEIKGSGLLDYVTCWHRKAAGYVRDAEARVAFVSTNSITQGEQVGVIWNELFRLGVKIDFAHRTFPWMSEARGKAHVHVVIVGFGHGERAGDRIVHDYGPKGKLLGVVKVSNISPYLTDGPDRGITNRNKPLCDVPSIGIGNKPIDGGFYLFTPDEKTDFLRQEPGAERYFRRWYGSREFLHNIERWCLWVGDAEPDELQRLPKVLERIEQVRQFRLESKSAPTRKIAATPTRFHVENIPKDRFLVLPSVSSERRLYAPIGYMDSSVLASNLVLIICDTTLYHFGTLHSSMHMAWARHVCGRMKSDYRYSAKLVYNNYPWPESPSEAQRAKVESAAQGVLDARENHPNSTLADLYDPLTMPADLSKAHSVLDRAVDRCYRAQPFPDERRRFEFLFARWEALLAPMLVGKKKGKRRKK